MDAILEQISVYGESQHLVPAEQLIMLELHKLDPFLVAPLSEEIIDFIESKLIALFRVNGGDFSIQCAMFIASKLSKLYQISTTPKLWDIINFTIKYPKATTIVATGYICIEIGPKYKAQLPRFIEFLMKQQQGADLAILYSLRACFKAGGKAVDKYVLPVFEYTKKFIPAAKPPTLMQLLKLFRTLIKFHVLPIEIVVESLKTIPNDVNAFVKKELSLVIGLCAFEPYSQLGNAAKKKVNEWAIKKDNRHLNLEPAFRSLQVFPDLLLDAWSHFLTLMGPEMISLNHSIFFDSIRKVDPEGVKYLIPMLPADIRYAYFREVSLEKLSWKQLKLLQILCPDDGSINEAAGVALLLSSNDDSNARQSAISYFGSLSETHPTLVFPYLHSALVYLAQPPEVNARMICDTRGNTAIARAILTHLADKNDGIAPNTFYIEKFITDTFTKPKAKSFRFICAFELLSALTDYFAELPCVKPASEIGIQFILKEGQTKKMIGKMLMKALFSFRSKFPDKEQNHHLIVAALLAPQPLPFSVISDLCEIIPSTIANDPMAFPATKLILEFVLKIEPTVDTIKSCLKRPLPTASNLLLNTDAPNIKVERYNNFLLHFINIFPHMIEVLDELDRSSLVSMLLDFDNMNVTSLIILKSICGDHNMLPNDFLQVFLSHLDRVSNQLMQCMCECLALYIKSDLSILPAIFNYIETHRTVSSCILVSAICSNLILPPDYITRVLIYINSEMKKAASIVITIHALSSLLLTHTMHLSSISITSNQFPMLFRMINTPLSLQPVALYVIGECFKYLVESFSSELVDPNSQNSLFVFMILRSIEMTPLVYAREIYFEISRAIYTFAHQLSNFAPINFPQSKGASQSLQLTGCAAFSDFLKFQRFKFKISELIPLLLYLLQTTDDTRAANFIVTIASLMKGKDIAFWVQTMKRIMITSSLLDDNNSIIEPSPHVKRTCLVLSQYLIRQIAEQKELVTEHLDDVISSISLSTETDRVFIQEAAFPPLQLIIELFSDRLTDEGQRLLDLYDSQFSTAVKIGFHINLSISGGFLSKYLTFNTDNMSNDPENCSAILVVYLAGLGDCQQRTTSYFSLATHLCTVARKYPPICDLIQPFLKTLSQPFHELVLEEMKLWKPDSDWRAMAHFRSLVSVFYGELLPAYVWLQKTSKQLIDINSLVSFLILEVRTAKEPWITNAAFSALSVAVKSFGDEIHGELFELLLRTTSDYINELSSMSHLRDDFMNLLLFSSALIKDDANYDVLRECLFSFACSSYATPKIIAYLLNSDMKRKTLSKYSLSLFNFILLNFKPEAVSALSTLLFAHSPHIIGHVVNILIEDKTTKIEMKLDLLSRALQAEWKSIPLDDFATFCISNFKKGGMHLIAKLLVFKPQVGISLVANGGAQAAFLLAQSDINNSRAYLRFIQLCLTTIPEKTFAESIFQLVVAVLVKFGGETHRLGRQIVFQGMRMIADVEKILGDKIKDYYSPIKTDDKAKFVAIMMAHIKADEHRKKTAKLIEIGNTDRGQRGHDEWQTLEICDDSTSSM